MLILLGYKIFFITQIMGAGIVLANGSLTSGNNLKNEEYFIRKSLIEYDLIES